MAPEHVQLNRGSADVADSGRKFVAAAVEQRNFVAGASPQRFGQVLRFLADE
jgi:hypothetical protein